MVRSNLSLKWCFAYWLIPHLLSGLPYSFTARSSYASAVLGIVIMSVCLSVCHTRALWRDEKIYCRHFDTISKGNCSSFLTPTKVGKRYPLSTWNLRLNWPTALWKTPTSTKSAYNVSTVRANEKVQLSLMGSQTIDELCTLSLTSPKGGWISECIVFANEI